MTTECSTFVTGLLLTDRLAGARCGGIDEPERNKRGGHDADGGPEKGATDGLEGARDRELEQKGENEERHACPGRTTALHLLHLRVDDRRIVARERPGTVTGSVTARMILDLVVTSLRSDGPHK
jgi:hypothetical protein